MSLPLVLTVPESAKVLRCSTDLVYQLCAQGELDHRRVGRRIIIPRRALLEFLGEGSDTTDTIEDLDTADAHRVGTVGVVDLPHHLDRAGPRRAGDDPG